MSIRMVIDVSVLSDGGVAVAASTEPFDMRAMPDAAGVMWVGICMAVNDYVRENGLPAFDCLKAMPLHPKNTTS